MGKDCSVESASEPNKWETVEPFYPEDINSSQTFHLTKPITTRYLRFVFNSSTDFFGRIIVYSLDIFGNS